MLPKAWQIIVLILLMTEQPSHSFLGVFKADLHPTKSIARRMTYEHK
jgi:hypothetical protein